MDPNTNLQEQESIMKMSSLTRYKFTPTRLRELRTALSWWLIGGGFEPDWTKAPTASRFYIRNGQKLWVRS